MPCDIKTILSASGFDTALSIASLKEENLSDIEDFLNTNREILKTLKEYEFVDCTKKFELKPGHRALISALPGRFESYLNQNKVAKTEKQCNKTENDLKLEIVKKVETFLAKNGFVVKLHLDKDVVDLKKLDCVNSYSCRIICPYCEKKVKCTFNSFWSASNLESHLKEHTKALQALQNAENNSETNNS